MAGKKKTGKRLEQFNIRLPEDLAQAVRLHCVSRKIKIQAFVEETLRKRLDRFKKLV